MFETTSTTATTQPRTRISPKQLEMLRLIQRNQGAYVAAAEGCGDLAPFTHTPDPTAPNLDYQTLRRATFAVLLASGWIALAETDEFTNVYRVTPAGEFVLGLSQQIPQQQREAAPAQTLPDSDLYVRIWGPGGIVDRHQEVGR